MNLPFERKVLQACAASVLTMAMGCGAHADDASVAPAERAALSGGAQIYSHICQGCHMPGAQGAVGAGHYPKLARDPALVSWEYAALTVLNGRKGMPAFGLPGEQFTGFLGLLVVRLTDTQVADIVNYIRSNFGNHYKGTITAAQVAALPHPGTAAPP